VNITSLEAYKKIDLNTLQSKVYHILDKSGAMTNMEISLRLELPINTVTGRVNELWRKGVIVKVGYKISDDTGNRQTLWRPVEHEVLQLRALVHDLAQYSAHKGCTAESGCKCGLQDIVEEIKQLERMPE
jgi:predicted transcriptional regulator